MTTEQMQAHTGKSNFVIAENSCYYLAFDLPKNRVYFTINGYWKSRASIPDFLKDWRQVMSHTMPGFTVQLNLSSMLTQPQELNELHLEAQRLMLEAGVLQVAQIGPLDRIAMLQVEQLYSKSRIPVLKFTTAQAAEKALDEVASHNQQ